MFSWKQVAIAAAVGLQAAASAQAGTVVLSGDMTPVFSLTNTSPNDAVAGNGSFFANVLGAGDGVAIVAASRSDLAVGELQEFYASRPGVSASLIETEITASALSGKDLLVAAAPGFAFTTGETDAIRGFLQGGGTLLLLGEARGISFGPATNGIINTLLSNLESPLRLRNADLDFGPQLATGTQIESDPLTAGVTSFAYGAASQVTGGSVLFRSGGGTPFVAYVSTPVPEPGAAALLALGLGVLAMRRRG